MPDPGEAADYAAGLLVVICEPVAELAVAGRMGQRPDVGVVVFAAVGSGGQRAQDRARVGGNEVDAAVLHDPSDRIVQGSHLGVLGQVQEIGYEAAKLRVFPLQDEPGSPAAWCRMIA